MFDLSSYIEDGRLFVRDGKLFMEVCISQLMQMNKTLKEMQKQLTRIEVKISEDESNDR